jgi:hypothetical protein
MSSSVSPTSVAHFVEAQRLRAVRLDHDERHALRRSLRRFAGRAARDLGRRTWTAVNITTSTFADLKLASV